MIAYFNGVYLDKNKIHISPDDRGFLFADGLYEVIRSYHGKLLGIDDHIHRLNYGAAHLNLTQIDFSEFKQISLDLIEKNNLKSGDATVYIQVTRGAAKRTHSFPNSAVDLSLYAFASKFDSAAAKKKQHNGAAAITVPDIRWARCDIKTVGLTANILANQLAVDNKAAEAIFVKDGVLLEGTHSNFMAVFDNVVYTAPLSNYILGGITRKIVLELCEKENIKVEERPVFEKDLHLASELMIVGTTVEVTPIVSLNNTLIKDGKPGLITTKIKAAFNRKIKQLTAS